MRHLFAVILVVCGVANPVALWEKYRHHLSEDFLRALRRATGDEVEVTDERVLNTCLSSLQDVVISIGGNHWSNMGYQLPNHHRIKTVEIGSITLRQFTIRVK